MQRPWLSLLVIAAAVTTVALVGSLSTLDAADQYAELDRPAWAPPGWLFGPVWTVLYAALAVSGWILWRRQGWSLDMQLWSAQLGVNMLWSPLFFAWGLRGIALAWILLLDGLVAWLAWRNRRDKAGWLLMPYLVWIAFATALNAAVWSLNR